MDLSQKCPKQWICREWVEELGLSEWDNNYIEFPGQSNRNEPSLYKKVCSSVYWMTMVTRIV